MHGVVHIYFKTLRTIPRLVQVVPLQGLKVGIPTSKFIKPPNGVQVLLSVIGMGQDPDRETMPREVSTRKHGGQCGCAVDEVGGALAPLPVLNLPPKSILCHPHVDTGRLTVWSGGRSFTSPSIPPLRAGLAPYQTPIVHFCVYTCTIGYICARTLLYVHKQ